MTLFFPCEAGAGRRRALFGALFLGLAVGGGAGCSTPGRPTLGPPGPGPGGVVEGGATPSGVRPEVLRARELTAALPPLTGADSVSTERAADAWAALIRHAAAHVEDPEVRLAVRLGIQGRERTYFEGVFARAAKSVKPLTPLVEDAAVAVGTTGDVAGWLSVVREVSGRGCCARRADLAAALNGLAAGLEGSAQPAVVQAEAALRLQELQAHRDPGVALAAQRLGQFFQFPEPGSGVE